MPRGSVRHDLLVKPAYPDGTATLPTNDLQSKASTGEQQRPDLIFNLVPHDLRFVNITQVSDVAKSIAGFHVVLSIINNIFFLEKVHD